MRLTCPAQRSARPDGDFVAGEGSGWRAADRQTASRAAGPDQRWCPN